MTKPCLYTIPAGQSFVDILAKGILDQAGDDDLALARMQILLPTRRAARSLREAFLRLSAKPLLLPRMDPIGDVDEEELSLTLAGMEEELSMPPAIAPLRRQFLLAQLIAAQGHGRGINQDLALADALGRLMDQVYTEDLDLAHLPRAVDREAFSQHWQISLDFLKLLSHYWPLILAEQGMIDAADRRNRLLKKLAALWQAKPPSHKIIAAGSTGSIPATLALLRTIAFLPQGCIVLPGLDQTMDQESWKVLDDTHPQATLRNLLQELETSRDDVALWPACPAEDAPQKQLRSFISEVMRPADTAQHWQSASTRLSLQPGSLPIERYDCASPQHEALVIALSLRGVLEDPNKTAALVTPDRKLARRVAMACRRWDIEIDDSAGQKLSETRVGTYLRLCIEALCAEMKPIALLDFCKHALCLPPERGVWRSEIRRLDETVFRGPAFQGGLEAYERKIAARLEKEKDVAGMAETIGFIRHGFTPLLALFGHEKQPFDQWCEAHLRAAEQFCPPDILWAGQDGEAASLFFASLHEQASLLPPVDAGEYLAILEQAMRGVAVRPAFGLHPRLSILGQLEARLVEADVMILAGLNEGTWPPQPATDPWMSRPMRKRFGLPPLERTVGLSAHDFAQSVCAQRAILTRSLRVDGTPTVPSRWLQRMETVLQACGLPADALQQGPRLAEAALLDHAEEYRPTERPAPRPPVPMRPRRLSATRIETWMKDPYSIYAQYILKLKPLDPLEQKLDARMRGTLIHDVLDRFVKLYREDLPEGAEKDFMTIAREELDLLAPDPALRSFWEPRLSKIASWVVDTERSWRTDMAPGPSEVKGAVTITGPAGPFMVTARADRIDTRRDGAGAALLDYKSGGNYSQKGIREGQYPQLPVEALILESGGFEGVTAMKTSALAYWVVNGAKDGGTICTINKPADLTQAMDAARGGLNNLIVAFDLETTPYYSLPRPDKAPRFNDYEHLARVREWTALDEHEDAA